MVLVSLLLTLNIFHTLFKCFHRWLWTSKWRQGKTIWSKQISFKRNNLQNPEVIFYLKWQEYLIDIALIIPISTNIIPTILIRCCRWIVRVCVSILWRWRLKGKKSLNMKILQTWINFIKKGKHDLPDQKVKCNNVRL